MHKAHIYMLFILGGLGPFNALWAQEDLLGALMDDIESASERAVIPVQKAEESAYVAPVRPEITVEDISTTEHTLVPKQSIEMPDFASFPRPTGRLLSAEVRLIEKVMDTSETVKLPVGRAIEKYGVTFYLRGCKRAYEQTAVGRIAKDRAFIDMVDAEGKHFFSGWMYNDAVGFHAPEHPNYDISLLECMA